MTNLVNKKFEFDISLGTTIPHHYLIYNGRGEEMEDMIFFTEGRNNRIGVGITNPAERIDIHDSSGANAQYMKFSNTASTNGIRLGQDANNNFLLEERDGNDIRFETTDIERMRIEAGGNIGIGTTNADELLHLYNTSNPTIRLEIATSTNGSELSLNSNNQLELRNNDNEAIRFYVNNTEKMRIKANGFVGINTTNPLELLHINVSTAGDSVYRINGTDAVSGTVDETTALGTFVGTYEIDVNGSSYRVPYYS